MFDVTKHTHICNIYIYTLIISIFVNVNKTHEAVMT